MLGGLLGCEEVGWERRMGELKMEIYPDRAFLSLSLRQLI